MKILLPLVFRRFPVRRENMHRIRGGFGRFALFQYIVYHDLLTDGKDIRDYPIYKQARRSVVQDEEEHDGHAIHHDLHRRLRSVLASSSGCICRKGVG